MPPRKLWNAEARREEHVGSRRGCAGHCRQRCPIERHGIGCGDARCYQRTKRSRRRLVHDVQRFADNQPVNREGLSRCADCARCRRGCDGASRKYRQPRSGSGVADPESPIGDVDPGRDQCSPGVTSSVGIAGVELIWQSYPDNRSRSMGSSDRSARPSGYLGDFGCRIDGDNIHRLIINKCDRA